MKSKWHGLIVVVAALAIVGFSPLSAGAAEFRGRTAIAKPAALPDGARPVTQPIPVDRKVVEKAIGELFEAYSFNTGKLRKLLAPDFLDRARLLTAMNQRLPVDARLRPLGIRSVQTLLQYFRAKPDGQVELVSTVTATVRAQLEFTDPALGFQRIEGTSEYLLRVRQPVLPAGPSDEGGKLSPGLDTRYR